jgi:chromosome segregation ATPase
MLVPSLWQRGYTKIVMEKPKFTTGILAQVWRRAPRHVAGGEEAGLRLVEIAYRIERAKRILEQIEQRAEETIEKIDRAERRFETLRDSFHSLQSEWKKWKKQNRDEE